MSTTRTHETRASYKETLRSQFETAQHVVNEFPHDEVFLDSLHQQGIDPDQRTSYEYAHALSQYAELYTGHYAEEYDEKTVSEVLLLANTPLMLNIAGDIAAYDARRKHGEYLNDDEWADYKGRKGYAVWYNQQLSSYMYAHGEVRFSDIVASLSDSGREYTHFSPEDTHDMVIAIARGARTEAVNQQILDKTDIPYRPGTPEEDLSAGDVIFYPDSIYIKGDAKSSLATIAELLGKGNLQRGYEAIEKKGQLYAITHHEHDQYGAIVFYSGFTDQDLGNACRLSDTVAEKKAKVMSTQLKRAFKEMKLPLDK